MRKCWLEAQQDLFPLPMFRAVGRDSVLSRMVKRRDEGPGKVTYEVPDDPVELAILRTEIYLYLEATKNEG